MGVAGGKEKREISNFGLEISDDGEEGSFRDVRPRMSGIVACDCGRKMPAGTPALPWGFL